MSTPQRVRRRRSSISDLKDSISDNIKSAVHTVNDAVHHTLSWNEIPDWMRDNEYILTGYRRAQGSWQGCWKSLFSYVHNESVNVHTHLWPCLLFIALLSLSIIPFPISSLTPINHYPTTSFLDRSHFAIFLASAAFCLGCSAIYHLAGCHSEGVARGCSRWDYTGIVILIVGSFYPCVYYGFFCAPIAQITYISAITIVGLGTTVVTLSPAFDTPAYRSFRACLFVSLGLLGIIPVTHAILRNGLWVTHHEMGFSYLLLSGATYVAGAFIYAQRFPERFFPGKFDLFLSSHQIFHVHVVLAAFMHYACVVKAFRWWHGVQGGLCYG